MVLGWEALCTIEQAFRPETRGSPTCTSLCQAPRRRREVTAPNTVQLMIEGYEGRNPQPAHFACTGVWVLVTNDYE